MVNKKFLAAMFTLSGSIIGAGILGLPYVFAQSGMLVGIFWLVVIGLIMLYVNLSMSEVTLRTKGDHQMPGYAEKYLGKWGKRAILISVSFGIYSALIAYLVGEGNSFSKILPFNLPPIFYAFIFWLVMTILLTGGLKELKKIETYGIYGIVSIIVGMFIFYLPKIQITNLTSVNTGNFMLPIGVVMFAVMGFNAIPEIRQEIRGEEKNFSKAITLGTLLPILLYIIFCVVFVGVLGRDVSEVATLSFGPLVNILGIFTMMTSFFVLSYALHDIYSFDLKVNKFWRFVFVSLVPLLLYALITIFNLASFDKILGIGGAISAGVTGTLILSMSRMSKDKSKPTKHMRIPISWPVVIILGIFLIAVIVNTLFGIF